MPASSDIAAETGAPIGSGPAHDVRRTAPAQGRVVSLALAGLFAAAIVVCSWVSVPIPWSPVPLTLQTLAVLTAGGLLGRVWGPVSVLVYLLLGLAGLPVFAGGEAGIGVLLGFKGGYLVGFVAAAFIMGSAGDYVRTRRPARRVAAAILATAAVVASLAIYVFGVPWLATVTGMGFWAAVASGAVPYLALDALKAAVAVVVILGVDEALSAQGLR
jgi:biotin transport system substrate-specific component